jgi:pimeloyl-ACP methyl ester carboxylesterase
MKVYFLSGLGADSRAYKHLKLAPHLEPVYIEWLIPETEDTLRTYAKRIAHLIDTSKPFALVGLSFGGILSTEVLEFVKPHKTIILSSVTNRRQLPFYYRLAGRLKLNKLLPAKATNRANVFTYWFFGISSENDKTLLRDILTSTNTAFSKWAVNEILNWKRNESPAALIRIHGSRDRVLPINGFTPDYLIDDAGHFMIVNRAAEISTIMNSVLSQ